MFRSFVMGTARIHGCLFAIAVSGLLAACAGIGGPPARVGDVPEVRAGSGYLVGYLSKEELPRSEIFLPPAPLSVVNGSTDDLAARAAFSAKDSPRWKLAALDADLKFPDAAKVFSCALGFVPSEANTPHLLMLLRRTLTDAALTNLSAKNAYRRPRPFMVLNQPTCTPADEAKLAKDGSYPSGHSAVGWVWALMLAEMAPERRETILRRGYVFGQSRVSCGVHWQSDVEAGRVAGAAAFAALQNSPTYVAQKELARKEVLRNMAPPDALPACATERMVLQSF